MDRRNFFKQSLMACGVVTGTVLVVESCKKSNSGTTPQGPTVNFTIDLSLPANASLNTTGGSGSSNGVVVVNMGSGSFIAVAQSCTHNGCSVSYSQGNNNFLCPCHGATFSTTGAVTNGPASVPLKKYTVTKNGNILTVTG